MLIRTAFALEQEQTTLPPELNQIIDNNAERE